LADTTVSASISSGGRSTNTIATPAAITSRIVGRRAGGRPSVRLSGGDATRESLYVVPAGAR
jgi:hypothetical protein